MRLNPWTLSLPVDQVGKEAPLERYYQDFSAALGLVRGEFHGPIDPQGIPLYDQNDGVFRYNAIIIAQYALALVPGALEGDEESRRVLETQADWLVKNQEGSGPQKGFWLQRFDNRKYPKLRNPWVSALSQGNALSALLRAHEILCKQDYFTAAESAFQAIRLPLSQGGVLWEEGEDLWLEEYPFSPPGHVLNGAIYALFGVLDYARVSGDAQAWKIWERGAGTVARHLPAFDTGFWSLYELGAPELTSLHYHKNIHLPQLQAFFLLTGDPAVEGILRRWRRYLFNPWSHIRRLAEGRARWRASRQ
jgi:heparosan-N-sulfate-glucuronate 5-epimerase